MRNECKRRMYPDESEDEFGRWAFGDTFFEIIGGNNFVDNWNKLHSNELRIYYSDLTSESLDKMIKLWREHVRTNTST